MTLPTFLGIGVPRAGTTWLHAFLAAHPEVYLPTARKEIRFFDRYFDHGVPWYEAFFCPPENAGRYRAIGEISPQYLYCTDCPRRIRETLPGVKLIVLLRHPVDRAYSNYGFVVQRRNYRRSFEEFIAARPQALDKGFYSEHLRQYLRYFDRSDLLALVFEEAVADREATGNVLAEFLGVSADRFPSEVGKVNASTVPRHGSASDLAVRLGRTLRRKRLEPVVDLAARLGGRRLIAKGEPLPRLDPSLKRDLSRRFEEEFDRLEDLLDLDLHRWRSEVAEDAV
jgi:hypothetical protein